LKALKKHTLDQPDNMKNFATAAFVGGKAAKKAFISDVAKKQTKTETRGKPTSEK
jgi:hypothetical protein